MRKRLGLIVVIASTAAAALGVARPLGAPVPCAAAAGTDRFCRLSATLWVTPAFPAAVADNLGHTLPALNYVRTNASGGVKLFFALTAKCDVVPAVAAPMGTKLRTRPLGFVFYQYYGQTICTVAGKGTIRVVGKRGLGPLQAQPPAFGAAVEPTADPTQLRTRFDPVRVLAVAVYAGEALVRFDTAGVKPVRVPAGRELVVMLDANGRFRSAKSRAAQFTPAEQAIFKRQRG